MGQIQSKMIYIFVTYVTCNLVLIEFAPTELEKVNKLSKFDNNFDIRCQFENTSNMKETGYNN